MGKIRIKTLGDEELEEEQKKSAKHRKEVKRTTKAPGQKGGERVAAIGPTEEELAVLEVEKVEEVSKTATPRDTRGTRKPRDTRKRSNRYKSAKIQVEKKSYPLSEAIELLKKLQKSKFDETVELHLNTAETGISGNLTLPHGTGKKTKVAIADDKLIAEVEKGKIDFDILVAEPSMMPKLAKVAKVLGPRGLMPNPKNGTVTTEPEKMIRKYEGGQIRFKTESKAPIIHLTVGKVSFGDEKLSENIKEVLAAVKKQNIKKAILKSTMSPAIKLEL